MRKPYFKDRDGPNPLSVTLKRRVRLEEVDALGIMWHGRYASFLEDGREQLGIRYCLRYLDFHAVGVSLPLRALHLDYLYPLHYAEEVTVRTCLHWHEGARLDFEYSLYNADNILACTGYSIQMMVDASGEILLEVPAFFKKIQECWCAGSLDASS